jgi:hypothetical protein
MSRKAAWTVLAALIGLVVFEVRGAYVGSLTHTIPMAQTISDWK